MWDKTARSRKNPAAKGEAQKFKNVVYFLTYSQKHLQDFPDTWCHTPSPRHSNLLIFQGGFHHEIVMELWIKEALESRTVLSFLITLLNTNVIGALSWLLGVMQKCECLRVYNLERWTANKGGSRQGYKQRDIIQRQSAVWKSTGMLTSTCEWTPSVPHLCSC